MAKKSNGGGGAEHILEKILAEMQKMNERFISVDNHLARIDSRLDSMDSRLEVLVSGYRDLRDRVTKLEED